MTPEDLLQVFIDTRQTDVENRFTAGETAFLLSPHYSPDDLAHYGNCSGAWVRQTIKVYRAFPTEESRMPYADMTYSHFREAAYTDDPVSWMDRAAEHGWSVAEMQKAKRGQVIDDMFREADRILGRVERCLDSGGPVAQYLLDHLTGVVHGHHVSETDQEKQAAPAAF